MKKIIIILSHLLIITFVFSQAPEKMSYQAVVRDASNALVTTQAVGMQISILQGSNTGTPVYVETQTPTTNANGLVTFEIGTGTTSDDFSAIDWASGPYFIKTETDPSEGTSYTISGTSQLLSVPYALHAKTVESVTETDPVYTGSQAANITATDITNLSNLSGINTGDQDLSGFATTISVNTSLALKVDKETGKGLSTENYTTAEKTKLSNLQNADGSETKVIAGTNITITGSGTIASPYVINVTDPVTIHTIGESYGGGIIFYVTPDGQHGLIAETKDQSTGSTWFNAQNEISKEWQHSTAGKNYTDWRLPTKDELDLLYDQRTIVGGFAYDHHYWCSTEYGTVHAFGLDFNDGSEVLADKNPPGRVRAIRSF